MRTITGRERIYGELERFVRDARHALDVASSHPGGAVLTERAGLVEALTRRAMAGLRVRVVGRASAQVQARLLLLPWTATGFRIVPGEESVRVAIADGERVLRWTHSDPGTFATAEEETAVVETGPPLVQEELARFEALWQRSRPLRRE